MHGWVSVSVSDDVNVSDCIDACLTMSMFVYTFPLVIHYSVRCLDYPYG